MSGPVTVTVLDVAQYILNKLGPISAWKLQKLCYYSQAWSLVWDEAPLFEERIEAWANGPVVPELYRAHRGAFIVSSVDGNPSKLSKTQKETIDAVLETYGDKTSQWLSQLTHLEDPWKKARQREGLAPGQRGNAEIRLEDMAEYYEALCDEEEEE